MFKIGAASAPPSVMDESGDRFVTVITRARTWLRSDRCGRYARVARIVPTVPMSRRQRIDCPHERRPGMAVCLHCLHADRVATRERRQRAIVRFIAWTLGLFVVGIVGAAGANAVTRHPEPIRPARTAARHATPVAVVASRDSVLATAPLTAPTIQLQGAPASMTPIVDSTAHAAAAPVAVVPPARAVDTAPPPPPRLGPIIPQGRTDLHDSLFAVRSGDTVVVNFDTGPARTRRADKFESLVRQTLRSVYGAVADTVLATVPDGKLASAKELVTILPSRGIHLRAAQGPRLALWPQTRPGRDGPLVVAYRTIVER
jgi:hypothetical protein